MKKHGSITGSSSSLLASCIVRKPATSKIVQSLERYTSE
eukprot:CAMPEP_0206629776 /NCGR_PEP_ID=MMETSP0325_2-20121206/67217_1 /ASSEMBLY_ACC=CAM_ASM_000347 /TAXON_ID=2866 /ORGANISM="Crypthecodinium cohnii, Strain Seligo" /LENGTH=38 /DNA_ID= /DNA_START= /DNA_END= /DNA_ORIENTATION=